MTDIQVSNRSITVTSTSGTTTPAAGTSESWSWSALASGIPTLNVDETFALVDASGGSSEIIRVTAAVAGSTSGTVIRGADGSTVTAHAAGATFNIIIVGTYLASLTNMIKGPSDTGRALRTFRGSYLGGVAGSPTDILVCPAASFEEGYGTSAKSKGWPQVTRDVLRNFAQLRGIAGGGSQSASSSSPGQAGVGNYYGFNAYQSAFGGGVYPDSPLISAAGTFAAVLNVGLGLRAIASTALSSTYTLEWFGTGIDIIYPTDTTYGSWTWAIDGGGATTINSNAASSVGNRGVQARNLERKRHTLVVVHTVAGSATKVVWEGAVFYDGDETSGIRMWEAGHAGYDISDFVAGTGQTAWVNSIQTWNLPDLVIMNAGFNGWNAGRTSAQIKADTLSAIAAIKTRVVTTLGGVTPSFVLMSSFSVIPAGSANVEPWANVVQAFYDIAAADDDVCVFDYQHWFGKASETAVSTRGGILFTDGLHPTDGGAAIIGGAMATFLLDSSERMNDLQRVGAVSALPVYNSSLASQGPGFAADTYITGSNCLIPNGRVRSGTQYRLRFHASKTAAGVATPILTVRTGTAGAIGDTSRVALTFAAQTAVADDGWFEVYVTFRSVGGGTAAVLEASGLIDHSLAATGFSTANVSIKSGTSSGFDSTTSGLQIGVSVNGGTSAAWTIDLVQAELVNLA